MNWLRGMNHMISLLYERDIQSGDGQFNCQNILNLCEFLKDILKSGHMSIIKLQLCQYRDDFACRDNSMNHYRRLSPQQLKRRHAEMPMSQYIQGSPFMVMRLNRSKSVSGIIFRTSVLHNEKKQDSILQARPRHRPVKHRQFHADMNELFWCILMKI